MDCVKDVPELISNVQRAFGSWPQVLTKLDGRYFWIEVEKISLFKNYFQEKFSSPK